MSKPTSSPADSPANAAGLRQLGDFVLEREIGRGGMGVVYLAKQQSIARRVALKVLPSFAGLDREAVARFRREAEAAGRLSHPGIVPIHAVGETDGVHWYAMELIEGPTLGQLIGELGLRRPDQLRAALVEEVGRAEQYPSLRERDGGGPGNGYVRSCARLCLEVADALAAAHREGVIHRDVKPSNILVHASGRPVLVDFGLARDERQKGLTNSGDQIGTPSYMAPEQAAGRRRIDARVDVYALGAVLHELLTLCPPFDAPTAHEVTHRILTETAPSVLDRNCMVPVDLAAIVHKCLAKDPEDRYPAMEALALDLRDFLRGRSVNAEMPTRLARVRAALQRHRRTLRVAVGAAVAATSIAFAAGIVNDRGDVRDGFAALEEAGRVLRETRESARARDLYERAMALTKQPETVRERRLADFEAAFAGHYGDGPAGRAALRAFSSVFDGEERRRIADLLDRLDGRGSLRIASRVLQRRTRELAVRRLQEGPDGGLEPAWQPVAAGAALPVGEYLVRAEADDGVQATFSVRIVADQVTEIVPDYVDPAAVPARMMACLDPKTRRAFAVGETEVSRGDWRAWLEQLAPDLRDEMDPGTGPNGEGDDLPVRNLSFHQARTYASAHGGHLPTAREHWLAASSGLAALVYPWGNRFDPSRMAADPFHLAEAEPVRSRADGRSPIGAFHLLGNVAEILSVEQRRLAMGGGHFLDDPKTLVLRGDAGTVPLAELAGAALPMPQAGMRLYRFLAPPDGDGMQSEDEAGREELRARGQGCVFHDWSVADDGRVECRVELNGSYDARERGRRIDFATIGFVQSAVRLTDGHGKALPFDRQVAADGEASELCTELPSYRQGQGYRMLVTADLVPTTGLGSDFDVRVFRLPLKRGQRLPQAFRLTLPASSEVVDVSPPAVVWFHEGRPMLKWNHLENGQIETAVVRFRVDGSLGAMPSLAAAARTLAAFLEQWNRRDARLGALLAPGFVQRPAGSGREHVLRGVRPDRLTSQGLVDVTGVGTVTTIDFVADWTMPDRGDREFRVGNWPMQVLLQQEADGMRVLRLQPRTSTDQGRYGAHGYEHAGLRARVESVPGFTLARTQDQLTAMQVRFLAADDGVAVQVLGHFAAPDESLDAIRFRLTDGDVMLRAGRCLEARRDDDQQWTEETWEFTVANGAFVRERWRFLQRGLRHFLIRCAAFGADADAAARRFDRAEDAFASIRAAITID